MKKIKDQTLLINTFNFSPKENGGESLYLTTKFIGNGDKITETSGVYLDQELTLQSYGNSASINLSGITLNPANLRELANELESARNKLLANKKFGKVGK